MDRAGSARWPGSATSSLVSPASPVVIVCVTVCVMACVRGFVTGFFAGFITVSGDEDGGGGRFVPPFGESKGYFSGW
ncbi:hypothetical protein [Streptantibioticus silvisoli]|uniref:Uncharacterized protein n=1 Tax=Streptantibioticus silvisoli TaxID=2705255 RepID=A0ABT6W7S1_9ACTN|nr:hypothetical protein [Streptantibioticus silvisoli]MDI5966800.1 hypothetical protein [Streptantibioticus silvisoli]